MNMDWFSTRSDAHISYHYFMAIEEKTRAESCRTDWQKENLQFDLSKKLTEWGLEKFFQDNFLDCTIDMSILPLYSFLLQFEFVLEKPYISRDDQEFYIIDNPVRKDKVFKLPYVSSTSWKGSLRAALWQLDYQAEEEKVKRIFGNDKKVKEHEGIQAGRVHFFPTFFTKKGLELINPHDRERRVAINPILLESVPTDTSGLFTLLYVPFDLIGKEAEDVKTQLIDDLQLIIEGVYAMFRFYGFGAKTASGYGIAKPDFKKDGQIILKTEGITNHKKEVIELQVPEESFMKYLNEDGNVKKEYRGSGDAGLLSNKEYKKRKEQLGGDSLNKFKKFRQWYDSFGKQWQEHVQSQNAPEPVWPIWTFKSFEELREMAEEIARAFRQKEGEIS